MVPVCRLQDHIIPKLSPEHFLKQRDHGPQRVRHPVVCLLEGDDEHVDVLDLVPERRHQVLDGLLLLQEPVSEPRGVDHSEQRPWAAGVAQPVALVSAGPLGDAVQTGADLEAAVVEAPAVVILVATHEDVSEAGLAHADRAEDDDPGAGEQILIVRDTPRAWNKDKGLVHL